MSTERNSFVNPIVENLPPSGIRKFFDLVTQTEGVISLGVGEPDFVTPWHIRESCYHSLEKGYTTYTSNLGLLELREEISKYLKKYDLDYNPDNEILITVGVSEAVDLAFRSILLAGEEVLIPDPSYVSYAPGVTLAGGVPVAIPTFAKDNFRLSVEELEKKINEKTKAIVLTFPNNPTGAIMEKEDLEKIAKLAIKHNLVVLSDEIYCELTYDNKHFSIGALEGMKERTIVFNGFSKSHAMTGWRVGYAVGPVDIIAAMMKIHQYTILCAPIMGQKAAIEALRNGQEEMDKMIQSYNQRRNLMVNGFREIGLECVDPKGAFYAFPSIKSTGLSSDEFAERLLLEEKVAVVPGSAFGECGEGYIRCCYAASFKDINIALERINNFIKKLQA